MNKSLRYIATLMIHGKSAWMAEKSKSTPVAPVEKVPEKIMKMEESMKKDPPMMEETMMEKETEADMDSVLRLSRANVPATIPLQN